MIEWTKLENSNEIEGIVGGIKFFHISVDRDGKSSVDWINNPNAKERCFSDKDRARKYCESELSTWMKGVDNSIPPSFIPTAKELWGTHGADWIKSAYGVEDMSELGENVATMMHIWQRGIHHIQSVMKKGVDWSNKKIITIHYGMGMDSFDSGELTRLIVLCHDCGIRVKIMPYHYRYLELMFTQRVSRVGSYFNRMPTMEEHIDTIRSKR